MFAYTEITELHLEVTSACNAHCPQCPRNEPGGFMHKGLPVKQLTLEEIQKSLEVPFVRQLKHVYLCGNYGDPMAAQDTLPILEWLRDTNAGVRLGMFTNGSGRDEAWWARLAKIVNYCRFGIDGIGSTNALYRRGTDWDHTLRSVKSFIAAGGIAEWDFIVFKHNEHEILDAQKLARELGFSKLHLKSTARFYYQATGALRDRLPVYGKNGLVQYWLEPPINEQYQNIAALQLNMLTGNPEAFDHYLNTTTIKCKALFPVKLYISSEGLVFPCCYLAHIYPPVQTPASRQLVALLDELPEGRSGINIKLHSLRDIISGPFFQQVIPTGWDEKPIEAGRIRTCARACGNCDLHASQLLRSMH